MGAPVWPSGSKTLTQSTDGNCFSVGTISFATVIVEPPLPQPRVSRSRAMPPLMVRWSKPQARERTRRSPLARSAGVGPAKSECSTAAAGDEEGTRRCTATDVRVLVHEEDLADAHHERCADLDHDAVGLRRSRGTSSLLHAEPEED